MLLVFHVSQSKTKKGSFVLLKVKACVKKKNQDTQKKCLILCLYVWLLWNYFFLEKSTTL